MGDGDLSRRTVLGFIAGTAANITGFGVATVIDRQRTQPNPSTGGSSSVDTSEPGCENNGDLETISNYQLATDPRAISIRGSYALVSGVGFSVVDITNPREMVEVTSLPAEDVRGFGHVCLDNYAYMTNLSKAALTIVDISDMTSPDIVGEFEHPQMGSPRKVISRDDYLYISSHDATDTFSIVDVSDREQPEMVGSLSDPNLRGRGQEIELVENFAIVTNKDNDVIQSIDISDPAMPVAADAVALGQPFGLYQRGDILVVTLTNRTNGIAVLDVSDPTEIELVTKRTDNALDSVYGMDYEDGYLYGADKYGCHGYHAISLNPVKEPRVTDSVSSSELVKPYDVALNGGTAFVVSRDNQNIVSLSTHNNES